ncbi:hypothetical protein SNOG_05857 [Parastagonospora nodorum SN15]|uniref:Uncharacterized protein n=1 Tax=Phaeosphaeria nodorum (strain SN15 / ATCC MYA-4574 / FGSC 10173) TaxID=321614 RepID=Q0UQV7_PHANO|nr:hypothetical protein SNOG_05857 [Parastagonospora nodorum SN15]EAT86921.2 hypothetical protein SNOG_05857 [Parastagonospora nodorum SN15]
MKLSSMKSLKSAPEPRKMEVMSSMAGLMSSTALRSSLRLKLQSSSMMVKVSVLVLEWDWVYLEAHHHTGHTVADILQLSRNVCGIQYLPSDLKVSDAYSGSVPQ